MKKSIVKCAAALVATALIAFGATSPAMAKSSVTVVAPFTMQGTPYNYYGFSAVSPDGSLVAVNIEYAGVSIIDVATRVQHDIPISAFGTSDTGHPVFSPDNKWLYIADYSRSGVIVIDLSDFTFDRVITADMENLWALTISPDGTKLFARSYDSGLIYKIDLSNSDTISGPANDTGTYGESMCISPDGSTLYSPTYVSDSIAVIDTANMTVTTQWAAPVGSRPHSCTLDNEGNLIIAMPGSDSVAKYAIDGTYTISSTDIAGNAAEAAASCDTIYIADDSEPNAIPTVDLATLSAGDPVIYPRANLTNSWMESASRSADGSVVAIGGYYSDNGLVLILSPECRATPAAPTLPDTGTDGSVVGTSLAVSLGLLMAGALALVVIRRRKV